MNGITPENGFIALNLECGRRDQTRREWHESLPDSFLLEYAIEGKITMLDKAHIGDINKESPGMTLLVILDEQKIGEAKNTDVAIRVKGCGDNASCQCTGDRTFVI